MRTSPSAADKALIETLAAEGHTISATQLERWRARGLLERSQIERNQFGGSRVLPHDDRVLEACKVLSDTSRQGRAWQFCGIWLFEEGFPLSTKALRATAEWLRRQQVHEFERAWKAAEIGTPRVWDSSDDTRIADVATRAARSLRAARPIVQAEVRAAHPHLSASELREATESALVWRCADISAAHELDEEQRQLARHGLAEPLSPFADVYPVLPSERKHCIGSLTIGEAETAREFAYANEHPLIGEEPVLSIATWIVTLWRLRADFDRPDVPPSSSDLMGYVPPAATSEPPAWDAEGPNHPDHVQTDPS